MASIKLLDCTLRDGGYINNWQFGYDEIKYISKNITEAGIEIVELGFLRDEVYSKDRAVWNSLETVNDFVTNSKDTLFALMGESFNMFPIEKIVDKSKSSIDIIRIICWRKLQKECIEYCKKIADKGYKVCIQPDRVNQYSIDEFKQLCEDYSKIEPYAIYVVDSNGFLSQNEILKYLRAADEVLPDSIILGYHGHNSIMQAEGAAELFADTMADRDIIVDGSIYGIGRASGNLNIEIFANYLNRNHDKKYDLLKLVDVYQNCISKIYENNRWGYSMESFLSSVYQANPNYASMLSKNYNLAAGEIAKVISSLSDIDKVITNRDILPQLVSELKKG